MTDVFNADRTITRTTEDIDPDGNVTTTVEIIEEGADDEEGPTGNANN